MRKIDLNFTVLKLPLDFVALMAAAVTAYTLRFSKAFVTIRPILTNVPFEQYLWTAASLSAIWIIFFALAGLYSTRSLRPWNELGRLILSSTAGIMAVIAIVFFQRQVTTSRFIILAVWLIAIFYVWFGRLFLRLIRHLLLLGRIGHQRVVVIGKARVADELTKLYRSRASLGYTVVKTMKTWNKEAEEELLALAKARKIDGVLLADPSLSKEEALEVISVADSQHLTFRYLADLFAARFSEIEVATTAGIPIIEVKRTRLDGWGRVAKRLFDLVVSAILIVILSPVMIVTAIAIKLDSKGSVLFSRLPDGTKTERIGEGGKPFHYFKFRSMIENGHWQRYNELQKFNLRKGDPLVKIKNDPRVTRVGRFIRKWSIDELPELILVFLGRMSLVGPRPHLPEEVDKYERRHRQVLAIKPGITGMAQTSGRSDLDFEEEVRLDAWYIKNWSLWLDLYILLKTPFVVVTHRGIEEGV
ncbi:MAG: sugar transferase [bacterium]|nr:sugar transferase [bacterium]